MVSQQTICTRSCFSLLLPPWHTWTWSLTSSGKRFFVAQTLTWRPPSVLCPRRKQRGVQETGAVDHVHRHGDQPAGKPVHGPLLRQQVRPINTRSNIPTDTHCLCLYMLHRLCCSLWHHSGFIQSKLIAKEDVVRSSTAHTRRSPTVAHFRPTLEWIWVTSHAQSSDVGFSDE